MFKVLLDIIIYILLSALLSWIFYYWKRKDLLGGFVGGVIVGLLGSILGAFLLSWGVQWLLDILQQGFYISNVNVVASLLGGYLALYIFNKINHDKIRKDF